MSAIVSNIGGTSEEFFKLGISGPAFYHGTADPSVTPPTAFGALADGDIYIRTGTGNEGIWILESSTWYEMLRGGSGGTLTNGDLDMNGNSITSALNVTGTGTFLAGSGSAAAPSIGFSTDSDTGFYRIGADAIGITIGGSFLSQITAAGQLIWGHTASVSAGNGVGTGGSMIPTIQVHGTGNNTTSMAISMYNSSSTASGKLAFNRSRNASVAGQTMVSDNDDLGQISANGSDGTDFFTAGGRIRFRVDGTPAANRIPTEIVMGTAPGSADDDITDWVRLSPAGNWEPMLNGSQDLGSASKAWQTVYGEATSAQYADLAERYRGKQYLIGTVVVIDTETDDEFTESTSYADEKVLGVISGKPAHLMNDIDPDMPAIALRGRVPVQVTGRIRKGDLLVSSHQRGIAGKASWWVKLIRPSAIFAKALEDNDGTGVVEAVIL